MVHFKLDRKRIVCLSLLLNLMLVLPSWGVSMNFAEKVYSAAAAAGSPASKTERSITLVDPAEIPVKGYPASILW
jgi:hypothetical protein